MEIDTAKELQILILSQVQAKVIECSATDLIGQYVGQTGPKVQKLLEQALGKVLFIDEAYRLAEGGFATEAMDELVDCLTKPKFAQKLVTILAGYDNDIDRLLSINPGLSSRFPDSVAFPHLDPMTCLELLTKVLQKRGKEAPINMSVLTARSPSFEQNILELLRELCSLKSWGNARDIKTLGKDIFGKLISTAVRPITNLVLTEGLVIESMKAMLEERLRRSKAVNTSRFDRTMPLPLLPQVQHESPPEAQSLSPSANSTVQAPKTQAASTPPTHGNEEQKPTFQNTKTATAPNDPDSLDSIFKAKRDPGVSDAIWEQLERDKRAAVARQEEYQRLQKAKEEEEERLKELVRAELAAKDDDEKRQREQERIQAELARRRNEAILAEMERVREKERAAQEKLRELGPCPAGFRWVKQMVGGGYRCAGGSHWLSDAELGL